MESLSFHFLSIACSSGNDKVFPLNTERTQTAKKIILQYEKRGQLAYMCDSSVKVHQRTEDLSIFRIDIADLGLTQKGGPLLREIGNTENWNTIS